MKHYAETKAMRHARAIEIIGPRAELAIISRHTTTAIHRGKVTHTMHVDLYRDGAGERTVIRLEYKHTPKGKPADARHWLTRTRLTDWDKECRIWTRELGETRQEIDPQDAETLAAEILRAIERYTGEPQTLIGAPQMHYLTN